MSDGYKIGMIKFILKTGGFKMEYIRKFYEGDLDKVMKIWLEGNLSAHTFIGAEQIKNYFGYVSRLIPKAEVYVYEMNGEVVGFVGLSDQSIQGFFVEEQYQGLGIGTRLLNFIKSNYEYFDLMVFEKNVKAIEFYEKSKLIFEQSLVNEDFGEIEHKYCYRLEV